MQKIHGKERKNIKQKKDGWRRYSLIKNTYKSAREKSLEIYERKKGWDRTWKGN